MAPSLRPEEARAMEASLHIKSWVHAEADSIHPNSSRITAAYGETKNECGLESDRATAGTASKGGGRKRQKKTAGLLRSETERK